MHADNDKTHLKNVSIAKCNALLREVALLLFDSFHPASQLVTLDDGRQRYKAAPRSVTKKVGNLIANVLKNRTYIRRISLSLSYLSACL